MHRQRTQSCAALTPADVPGPTPNVPDRLPDESSQIDSAGRGWNRGAWMITFTRSGLTTNGTNHADQEAAVMLGFLFMLRHSDLDAVALCGFEQFRDVGLIGGWS